jgi:hypothetical protein
MKSVIASLRTPLHRVRSVFGACLALVLFLVPLALAATVSASITDNTVTYSAAGLSPNEKYSVKIENASTGSSVTYQHTTTADGTIPESTGITGDTIAPGTTVNVKVCDKAGNPVASTSVTKPERGSVIKAIVSIIKIVVPFL